MRALRGPAGRRVGHRVRAGGAHLERRVPPLLPALPRRRRRLSLVLRAVYIRTSMRSFLEGLA